MKCYECKVDMRKIGEREFCCSNTFCPLVCEEFDVQSLRETSVVQFWFCKKRDSINELNDFDLSKQQLNPQFADSNSSSHPASDLVQESDNSLTKDDNKKDILLYLLFVLCLIIVCVLCK